MRNIRIVLSIIVGIALIAVLAFGYIWVSGGSGEPSTPITAATLAIATRETAAEPTDEAMGESTAETATNAATGSEVVVFNIVPEQSEVRFTLTEELRGQPTTVVGTTNQVAGQIAVDFSDPQTAQIGEIRINARTLATDQEMRNRTIRSQILQSAQADFEFISFVPTSIDGLPETATVGESVSFQITGDLTIRNITQPVTFEATITPVSESQIEGTATTTVQRAMFELTIPRVPTVANVSEDVDLAIDFVATAAE